jgi:hypothetical protein
MAAFEALCEGFLGMEAHWHMLCYFFKFVCLKDNRVSGTIGSARLRAK